MKQICGMDANEFYDKYYNYIYNYFFYNLMQKHTAEDLTGETLLRTIRYAESYDPKASKLITWIMAIAKNVLNEHYKKNRRNNASIDIDEWKELLEDEKIKDPDEKLNMLFILGKLEERERNVVYQRYYLELSYKEIAESLNLTEKNVSVILTRTLKKLKQILEYQY